MPALFKRKEMRVPPEVPPEVRRRVEELKHKDPGVRWSAAGGAGQNR